MSKPLEELARFDKVEADGDESTEGMMKRYEAEHAKYDVDAKDWLAMLHKATALDYVNWLYRYLQQGGRITHSYDYRFPDGFYWTRSELTFTKLYGSSSVNVIVLGDECEASDVGHNNIYQICSDGRALNLTKWWVPVYPDVRAMLEELQEIDDSER